MRRYSYGAVRDCCKCWLQLDSSCEQRDGEGQHGGAAMFCTLAAVALARLTTAGGLPSAGRVAMVLVRDMDIERPQVGKASARDLLLPCNDRARHDWRL
jgi:hypothetical protein